MENCSVLEARLYIISTRWYGVTYYLQGQAAGRDFSSNYDDVYIDELGTPALAGDSWSFRVDHMPDGTGALTVSVSLRGYTVDGNYGNGWRIEGSRTVELTPIARASTVEVTDGAVGGTAMIAVTRKNSSYTHQLHYSFGDLTGYITQSGAVSLQPVSCTATAIAFYLPEEFYSQMTDRPSAPCTVSCTTFDEDRQVGEATQAVFTVTAPESLCRPTLTAEIADVNPDTLALTGDPTVVVRFMSRVHCTALAQGLYGATVKKLLVQGQPVPAVLDAMERYSFSATDSRGYECTQVLMPTVVPYVLPTVNGTCSRVDPSGGYAELTVRGSCFWGSFGLESNSLRLTASVDGRQYPMQPVADGDSYHAALRLEGLSYEQDYSVLITARDALSTVTAELQISRGEPVFDWGKRDFAFHVPVTAPRLNGIKNPALKAWPVGAVMITNSDPGDAVGGKWTHFTIPGIDLDAWRRIQGADTLGTAKLGKMVLGTEE